MADEEELEERPKGPLQDPRITILEPKKVSLMDAVPVLRASCRIEGHASCCGERLAGAVPPADRHPCIPHTILTGSPSPPPTLFKFFGISGFGFTKENELFVGRVAQLGFAAGAGQRGRAGGGARALLALAYYTLPSCLSSANSTSVQQLCF